jgi:hypothetical protein
LRLRPYDYLGLGLLDYDLRLGLDDHLRLRLDYDLRLGLDDHGLWLLHHYLRRRIDHYVATGRRLEKASAIVVVSGSA